MSTSARHPASDPERVASKTVSGAVMRSEDILRALRGILVTGVVGSAGALAGGLIFDDRPAIVFGALALLGLPVIWRMVALGRATEASLCLLGLFNLLTIYALVFGGGVQDPTATLFPVMLIASGILLERRLAHVASVVLVASCIGVGVAEYSGLIVTNLSHELSGSDVAFQAILIIAVAILVSLMSRALRDSIQQTIFTNQSYGEIFNASGEGIIVHDATSRDILEVNDAALAMFGYTRANAAEFTLDALAGADPIFSRSAFEERLERAEATPTRFEWCASRRQSEPVWLEVTVRSAAIRGHDRVVSVLRDTSERRALEEQVHQAEKLRAVGQLARGVAHDFNNQLTVILANASLLESGVASDPDLTEYTQAIIESSRRSSELTQQLLAFARKGQRRDELVDVDELVAEVKSLLARSIDKRIEVVHDRSAQPALTRGDSTFLQNALLNLGLNARDAMPEGGTLRFSVEVVGPPSPETDRQVRIRVEDNGCGMSHDIQEHIFEPFYTTKKEGNGMGLAAVYGTVVAHEGTIAVDSDPGHGTRFIIDLPAAHESAMPPARGSAAKTERRFEGMRVLLAEDEPGVGRVARRILGNLGCEVTHCEEGESALALLEGDGGFDVALLDHSMPGRTGAEILEALRVQHIGIPVIVMSGYTEARESSRYRPDAFVPKPFTAAGIAEALEKALAGSK